jgi:hypothetical protein
MAFLEEHGKHYSVVRKWRMGFKLDRPLYIRHNGPMGIRFVEAHKRGNCEG